MNIKSIIGGFKLKCCKTLALKEHIAQTDLGILKVAFMVAVLDGEATDEEYEAFDLLAKKCRGYTPENAATALKEAMHSAGYLLLVSKRLTTAELVKEFIAEAKKALPEGFAYYPIEDVRRAIVTWIAVGMSDGDYSKRERACIKALRKEFAELVVKRENDEIQWRELSPMYCQAFGAHHHVTLVDKDFVTRVEELAAQCDDSKAVLSELRKLIQD